MSAPPGWSFSENHGLCRPLDQLEMWYYHAALALPCDRELGALTGVAKLKFPCCLTDPTPYVRRTWLVSRHLHPHLGAVFSGTVEDMQLKIDPLDPKEWLATTFFVQEGDKAVFKSPAEVAKACRKIATATATAHWFPNTSEFVICTSHLRVDGIGLLKLLHSFMLSLVSVIRLGLDIDVDSYFSNVMHPSPSLGLDIITKSASDGPSTPAYVDEASISLANEWLKSTPSISLPIREGSHQSTPKNTKRMSLTFNEAKTRAMKKSCVENGISVASAVQTALIRVTASFPQHPTAKNMRLRVATDIRKLLPTHYNSPEGAVALRAYTLPRTITAASINQNFDRLAKEVNGIYKADLANFSKDQEGKAVSFIEILAPYLKCEMEVLGQIPPEDLQLGTPVLSSLGLMEKHVERQYNLGGHQGADIELDDIWLMVEIPCKIPLFHLYIFHGRATLQVCFNESYYDEIFIKEVLEKIRDDLVNGLQI